MEMLALLDKYIEQLSNIVRLEDDEKDALIEDVTRIILNSDDLNSLVLDYYHSDNPDYIADARKLKAKLMFTRASLIDANEEAKKEEKIASEQRELERLRLQVELSKGQITIQNTNHNENNNNSSISITFDNVRDNVNAMTSLPEEEIKDIRNKIDELENIVKSTESKSKKWSNAKEIIKWIADKGVDVGLALLPLLLKIS